MSSVFLEISDRAFGAASRPTTGEVVFDPNSYRQSSMGGPIEMSITAFGPRVALFDLIELLRCPIRMFDSYAQDLFWGYINEVQVRIEALELSVTLNGMTNKVAVEYTNMVPGEAVAGEQLFTDWVSDAVSIGTYGTKEMIASLSDVTTAVAQARRDVLLQTKKYPIPTWYMSGESGSLSASLLCRGWFGTLDWKYYQNTSGYEAYTVAGEGVQKFGDSDANTYVAQGFRLGVAVPWSADRILVKMRKEAAPTDSVRVSLYNDSAGVPGTELAFALITGSNLPTDYNWVDIQLNTRVPLSIATQYWIVMKRSGSADATNYYFVDVNQELGYPRGSLKIGNLTPVWTDRSPDADMNFEVMGVIETTQQLQNIATSVGQFITAVKLETASGIYSCPYRPGTSSGLEDALELLKCGTSNGRRMLAQVTPARVLRIFEEPARPEVPTLLLTSTGRIKDRTGSFWPKVWSPVGQWVGMRDAVPTTLDTTRIADPYMVFIDEYSYSFIDKVGTLYPRGEPSPWDVGVVPTEDRP